MHQDSVDAWGVHTRLLTKICSTLKRKSIPAWSDKRSCVLPGKSCNITTGMHKGLMHLQIKGLRDGNLNGLLCVTPQTNPQLINCWCQTLVTNSGKTFFFVYHKNKGKIKLAALCNNLSICPRLSAVANQIRRHKLISYLFWEIWLFWTLVLCAVEKKGHKVTALWILTCWR